MRYANCRFLSFHISCEHLTQRRSIIFVNTVADTIAGMVGAVAVLLTVHLSIILVINQLNA